MKIYVIKHAYDEDGGYGDAVRVDEVLFTTSDKEFAEAYCAKWNKPYVYDTPYADLYCNNIYYEEMELDTVNDLDTSPSNFTSMYASQDFEIVDIPENANDEYVDIATTHNDKSISHRAFYDIYGITREVFRESVVKCDDLSEYTYSTVGG